MKNISSFVESFSETVETIRTYKMERGDYPVCFLNGVLDFLSLVHDSPSGSYVAVYRESFHKFKLLEYLCLDPSLAITPVIDKAHSTLIMSGTISPLDLFSEIIGLSEAKIQTYPAIANPDNIRTILDLSVTTRFKDRTEKMILRYGERISKLALKIPNGLLVFFPQRKFMLSALDLWKKAEIITMVNGKFFLKEKRVFVEGSGASENRHIVDVYKREAKSQRGGVLCCVFRGRNAEGSNFPYEEARAVFLVGVPYADYGDPVTKAKIEYFNSKRAYLGDEWYVMDAFRAVNQAMGRGIRHNDDWCNFILMDHRYETHLRLISPWITANRVQRISG